jgi:hypothetical protein
MATTVTELVSSREWQGKNQIRHYYVTGTDDDSTAKTALLSSAPSSPGGGVVRDNDSVRLTPEFIDTGSSEGEWRGSVTYKPAQMQLAPPPEAGDIRLSATLGAESITLRQSISTVGAYGSGATTSDNDNLINATDEGVEGVSINEPVFDFSVTKVWASGSLPSLSTILSLASEVNDASITFTDSETGMSITLAAGECLFVGANFDREGGDGSVAVTYQFSARPNETGISIGSLTGIAKKGWEYLWARYQPAELGTLKVRGQEAIQAYVEKVYETGTLSGLGVNA